MSTCRCGQQFVGSGRTRLCPKCSERKRQRRNRERTYPKCQCGATLGLQAIDEGRTLCSRCVRTEHDANRQRVLNDFADTLISGGR